jgi:hypothetical protein
MRKGKAVCYLMFLLSTLKSIAKNFNQSDTDILIAVNNGTPIVEFVFSYLWS